MAIYDKETKKFYCECEPGCREECNFDVEFARGHHNRTKEGREKISQLRSGEVKFLGEEYVRRQSEGNKQAYIDDSTLASRHVEALRGVLKEPRSSEYRQHISEAMKEYWRGVLPKEKERHMELMREAYLRRPTRTESLLDEWLRKDYPGEWEYVGDNQVRIGNRYPDFINVNSKKAVIELMGEFWHEEEDERDRIEHYKKYGFDCLVVWVGSPDDLIMEWATIKEWIGRLG